MTSLFLTGLVAVTSLAAYLIGIRQSAGIKDKSLIQALFLLLECVGTFAAFLAINVCLGAAIILIIRSTTTTFVSLYVLVDVMLIILSVLQGFAFQLWWRK